MKQLAGILVTSVSLVAIGVCFTNVSTEITPEDIEAFVAAGLAGRVPFSGYSEEVKLIRSLQARILAKFPIAEGIPLRQSREPADLNRYGRGLCYDRSRYLEKLLKYQGFETRHVYVLYRVEGIGLLESLVSKNHPSHAMSEVRTTNGWLLVDTNSSWLGVDPQISTAGALDSGALALEPSGGPLNRAHWLIRGLYSRSGLMYKPFVPFPDINVWEFVRYNWLP